MAWNPASWGPGNGAEGPIGGSSWSTSNEEEEGGGGENPLKSIFEFTGFSMID